MLRWLWLWNRWGFGRVRRLKIHNYVIYMIILGVLPCLLSSVLWGSILLRYIEMSSKLAQMSYLNFIEILWALSGFVGLLFFCRAIYLKLYKKKLSIPDYICALWGLGGVLAMWYFVIKEGINNSIIDLICIIIILPVVGLLVAWENMPKQQTIETSHGT